MKMAKKLYQEKQQFHDWFVIGFLSLATVGLLYGSASIFWRSDVTVVYSIACLILAAGIGYTIWWLLTSLRYKLKITDKKIKFQFKSITETSKKIAWDDIESCTLVKTPNSAKWQRPKATLTDEEFYSLDGRNGLMIETKDGGLYFIGCQNMEELQEALNSEDKIWEIIS